MARISSWSWPARLAAIAAALAFCVIVFGAFVRLTHAGLSCPDWPTCYGKATWPGHEQEISAANLAYPERPVENHKTWREQGHRMVAGSLGVLILVLALSAVWRRKAMRAALIVAAIAAAIGVVGYIKGLHGLSAACSALALALPLVVAARLDRPAPWRVAVVILSVVIFQAMLGMWTVTWLLKPIVVMGHLLGGLTTFSLMSYVALRLAGVGAEIDAATSTRRAIGVGLFLLGLQIALGGWTSANYAALTCGLDFPTCQGQWWPATDFHEGFILWRGIGIDYEGGVLDVAARNAIQMTHRIGALVVFCYLGWLAHRLARRGLRGPAIALGLGLLVQVSLGIANVKLGLPLWVALAHVTVAVLLLFTLILCLARSQQRVTARG
ncbi:COX15/CtaA family protein [Dokdonella immobilis]|uniref:Cytochrome c oxidase assembly protein subunit 15 n=1 Tax=Dokdonella immobilis TaxID=578942 RepID=A0A1I4WWI0_9GAMM|nr:COX15/CtaA family protein [Dokdonella immobilis]SFN18188.1 cytochrome c oxidase assembly protein subunit 15 [Dokdonella immobilis]